MAMFGYCVVVLSPLVAVAGALAQPPLATVPPVCPPSVPIASSAPTIASQGWQVYVSSELYLNAASPIGGPPERHADLAEYTFKPGKKQWSYTYDLGREFPEGKWLECGYGAHNEITLSRRLPDIIRSCTFNYRKGVKAGQYDIQISCR